MNAYYFKIFSIMYKILKRKFIKQSKSVNQYVILITVFEHHDKIKHSGSEENEGI